MKTPCKHPGCPTLLDRSGYCDRHASSAPTPRRDYDQHRRRTDPTLAMNAAIRSSSTWKREAKRKLAESPLCEDPHGDHARRGTSATAKQVHHIEGLASRPDLKFHTENLMSVCTRCHARIEAEVRKGAG